MGWVLTGVRAVLKVDHLTRLETRTKEFSMMASHWAR
jgi:hypothetical protein